MISSKDFQKLEYRLKHNPKPQEVKKTLILLEATVSELDKGQVAPAGTADMVRMLATLLLAALRALTQAECSTKINEKTKDFQIYGDAPKQLSDQNIDRWLVSLIKRRFEAKGELESNPTFPEEVEVEPVTGLKEASAKLADHLIALTSVRRIHRLDANAHEHPVLSRRPRRMNADAPLPN